MKTPEGSIMSESVLQALFIVQPLRALLKSNQGNKSLF